MNDADAAFERLKAEVQSLLDLLVPTTPGVAALTDDAIATQLIRDGYFRALGVGASAPGRMIDVGAAYGSIAKPFLADGWHVELFEPDPKCRQRLAVLAERYAGRCRIHPHAVGGANEASVAFHVNATDGLSGLDASPFGSDTGTIPVRLVRLADFLPAEGVTAVDFLKVDTEGHDFEALASHDFERLPPRLCFCEYSFYFPQQTPAAVQAAIADMAARGYDAVVFEYDDDGNFARGSWTHRLVAIHVARGRFPTRAKAFGNVLFYRAGDAHLLQALATLVVAQRQPAEPQAPVAAASRASAASVASPAPAAPVAPPAPAASGGIPIGIAMPVPAPAPAGGIAISAPAAAAPSPAPAVPATPAAPAGPASSHLVALPGSGGGTHRMRQFAMTGFAQARRALAEHWLLRASDALEADWKDQPGQLHRVLLASGVRDELLQGEEAEIAGVIAQALADMPDPAERPGLLLAAMLYLYPHEWPKRPPLLAVPAWLVDEYLKVLLAPPALFRREGEAEAYVDFATAWLAEVHASVTAHAATVLGWRQIGERVVNGLSLVPAYFNGRNLKELYRLRAGIIETVLATGGHRLDHAFAPRGRRARLKLGILAAHFQPGSETFAMLPLYRHLDRQRFEIVLFSLDGSQHALRDACAGFADQFVVLPPEIPRQVATLRGHDLDLIVIATNTTAVTNGVTLLAAHRLARTQIASVCSCTTTGFRNVDWYLSGQLSEPATGAQAHYTERLACVAGAAHCYDFGPEAVRAPERRLSRAELALPSDAVVYASGANFYKIVPELDHVWAEILARVPGSYLALYPFNPNWSSSYPAGAFLDRLTAALTRAGVDPSRLLVFPVAPGRADILERLRLADVYLDSFPFSGATSLLDPLEVGLPALALDGGCFRNLVAPAILREAGLDELVARDVDDYVARAVRLGTDRAWRESLAARVRALQNPRFRDPVAYAAEVGPLFERLATGGALPAAASAS